MNELGGFDYTTGYVQGWQCPVCKRVYAPFMPCCTVCGECQQTVSNVETGTNAEQITLLDYMKQKAQEGFPDGRL